MTIRLLVAVAAAALVMAAPASPAPPISRHDRDVIRFFSNHPQLAQKREGIRAMWTLLDHVVRHLQSVRVSAPADCAGATASACAWYLDGATQCEVSHEGGFTSDSGPPVHYAGRFQSDYSFETATAFGRSMEARYGRAWNWPHGAQIQHAYEEFAGVGGASARGWGPWPPYYRYDCSRFHGGTYSAAVG